MVLAHTSILGGLPVIIDISSGYDSWNNEYWSEVQHVYWRKRNGKPGKEIPQSVLDRAEKYDDGLCNAIEEGWEYLRMLEQPERHIPDDSAIFPPFKMSPY